MLPCPMFSSQSRQSPSSSPGFPPSVGLSVSASSSFSSLCNSGSSDPRLSPIRRPPCQHDNPSSKSSPALPLVTSHQSQVTISFRIRTCEKSPSNPFRIRTSKTQYLKPFRMNTSKKTGEGVSLLVRTALRWPTSVGSYSEALRGRKYWVPLTGSWRRRRRSWRSSLRSTKSMSEVLMTRRSEAA
jgi:hypothetical protein